MQYMPESLESGSPVGPIRVETLGGPERAWRVRRYSFAVPGQKQALIGSNIGIIGHEWVLGAQYRFVRNPHVPWFLSAWAPAVSLSALALGNVSAFSLGAGREGSTLRTGT